MSTAPQAYDLEAIRRLSEHGTKADIEATLNSLLQDHMKLLDYVRELSSAQCSPKLNRARHAELDTLADEAYARLSVIGEAINVLRG